MSQPIRHTALGCDDVTEFHCILSLWRTCIKENIFCDNFVFVLAFYRRRCLARSAFRGISSCCCVRQILIYKVNNLKALNDYKRK